MLLALIVTVLWCWQESCISLLLFKLLHHCAHSEIDCDFFDGARGAFGSSLFDGIAVCVELPLWPLNDGLILLLLRVWVHSGARCSCRHVGHFKRRWPTIEHTLHLI